MNQNHSSPNNNNKEDNKTPYYQDCINFLWEEFGHEKDVPEIDFSWQSWVKKGTEEGKQHLRKIGEGSTK